MFTAQEAAEIILNSTNSKPISEEIYINDSMGRICSKDIFSKINIPTFTRSAMDGYALVFGKDSRYREVKNHKELKKGCCIRINTGFPIPETADAVVEIEKTKQKDNDYIEIDGNIQKERNFTKIGTELKKGEILAKKGEIITARKKSLLAYAGFVTLNVYQKPIVGIITTGDEVVFPSCNLPQDSVYNSNFFILDSLVKKWHAQTIYFGHTPDDKAIFKERLLYALSRCDIVVTTGGVSKGTKDYTKGILKEIGADILIEKSTIKPGKPAAFAVYDDKYIFALPGWPAALYTVAYIYLKPFIMKFAGLDSYKTQFLYGILDDDMHSQKDKDYFNRINAQNKDGVFYLKSAGSQKTDNFFSIANSDGLVWIDTKKEDCVKGSRLPFTLFDD